MPKQEFKAESKKLLDLMINSIYTHKEIFLRELISNASDAIDKRRFVSLTEAGAGLKQDEYKITLTLDKDKRLLTVSDNGIGMNAEDMDKNLGVIASSGSARFRETMKAASGQGAGGQGAGGQGAGGQDAGRPEEDLIGQFGVGFYSAFMVADSVTVISRKYGDQQGWRWRSGGLDGYEIAACAKASVGTDVILHIREDAFSKEDQVRELADALAGKKPTAPTEEETALPDKDEYGRYLREYPIYKLVKKYSDYIKYPILMLMPHPHVVEGSPKDKPEYEEVFEYETLNSMQPIWQRPKSEVTAEEYAEFYRNQYDDKNSPKKVLHISVEGNITYKALLFIPEKCPSKYETDEYRSGLQLYSSGVKIMEHCMGLLPEAFDYVQGIVDSPDLTLNISRETLQHDRQLKVIASNIEKKIRAELTSMLKNEREEYEKFFMEFGRRIKVCAMDNYGERKDQLQDLLLFMSSKTGRLITLNEYVDGMKDKQKYIYFASGHTFESIDRLPQLEALKELDVEVLYFLDKADELLAQMFGSFKDRLFRSAIDGELGIEDLEEEAKGRVGSTDGPGSDSSTADGTGTSGEVINCQEVFDFIKAALGANVDEVQASDRLRSHPVCLSSGKGISFEMEKYFRAMQPNVPAKAKRILEINIRHEAIRKLDQARTTDPERAKKYAEILYNQACMIAGLPVPDPSGYTDLICSLF